MIGFWSALMCCTPSVLPPPSQILTVAIIAMAGLMCVVKGYVDTNILPHVTSHKEKKQKKKDKKPAEGGQKKKGSWELLTSSPRILNLTLMVGSRRALELLRDSRLGLLACAWEVQAAVPQYPTLTSAQAFGLCALSMWRDERLGMHEGSSSRAVCNRAAS
jgi:hypothetical protein